MCADRGYDYPAVHAALAVRGITDAIAVRRTPRVPLSEADTDFNHAAAKLRARVEYPFRVLKRQFGYTTARYRGLAKNAAHRHALCARVNLYPARHAMAGTG